MIVDCKQIADALHVTKRGIVMRANRETWPHKMEAVRGGWRKVFVLDDLPHDVRRTLAQHQRRTLHHEMSDQVRGMIDKIRAMDEAKHTAKIRQGEENLKKLMVPLLPTVQARFDGRYDIVRSWEHWHARHQPMGKKVSYWAYADAFNAGELTDISATVYDLFRPLKGRAVESYVLQYDKQGLTGLMDRKDGRHRRDKNALTNNPLIEKTAVALLVSRPHISMKDLTALLHTASIDKDSGEVLFEAPPYYSVHRFVKRWKEKNAELFTAATNPDQWKNKYMVAFGDADEDVTALNQRWEMDATPADWMLQEEDGNLRRYSVSVIIDVYSRRSLMVLSPTPRAETHKLALRLALVQWGVPQEIVTDNGRDYIAKEFLAVLKKLNITHHRTKPFSPWEKPFVERMNHTMLHSVLEVYSSFIGHNVAERSAIEARTSFAERLFDKDTRQVEMAMPAAMLQSRINQWLTGVYAQSVHEGIGMSPFAKAAAWRGEVRHINDVRALDVLLAPPAGKGSYVVSKKGLRIQGAQFIAMELSLLAGKPVQVYLTDDYGQIVVYHEGQFVCVARCPERSGISRQEVASHARQLQRQHIAQQRKAAKLPKLDPDALVSRLLQHKADAAGKLSTMPTPASAHRTAALDASGRAAHALDGVIGNAAVPAELQKIMDKQRDERTAPQTPASAPVAATNVAVIPETPQLRFRQWLALDALLMGGGTLDDPKLTRWYGTYPQTAEHAALNKRHRESLSGLASGAQDTGATVRRALPDHP